MQNNTIKKLGAYAAMAGTGLLSTGNARADVVYVDIEPDMLYNSAGSNIYAIDLDSTGGPEMNIKHSFYYSMTTSGSVSASAKWIVSNASANFDALETTSWYLEALFQGLIVSANQTGFDSSALAWSMTYSKSSSGSTYLSQNGNFHPGLEKFFAFRFTDAANDTLVGWMRVLPMGKLYDTLIVKDYAYENTPGAIITVGMSMHQVDPAMNVKATDVSDNGDATDMEIDFVRMQHEDQIDAYRVIIAKATDVVDLATAQGLPSNRYIERIPDGSDHAFIMPAGTTDKDGDAIAENTLYKVYVMSQAKTAPVSYIDSLALPSPDIMLTSTPSGLKKGHLEQFQLYSHNKMLFINAEDHSNTYSMVIRDINGRLIKAEIGHSGSKTIALNELSHGTYIVELKSGSEHLIKRIML